MSDKIIEKLDAIEQAQVEAVESVKTEVDAKLAEATKAFEEKAVTFEEKFDINFSIMTAELANFLPRLIAIFGGENRA